MSDTEQSASRTDNAPDLSWAVDGAPVIIRIHHITRPPTSIQATIVEVNDQEVTALAESGFRHSFPVKSSYVDNAGDLVLASEGYTLHESDPAPDLSWAVYGTPTVIKIRSSATGKHTAVEATIIRANGQQVTAQALSGWTCTFPIESALIDYAGGTFLVAEEFTLHSASSEVGRDAVRATTTELARDAVRRSVTDEPLPVFIPLAHEWLRKTGEAGVWAMEAALREYYAAHPDYVPNGLPR